MISRVFWGCVWLIFITCAFARVPNRYRFDLGPSGQPDAGGNIAISLLITAIDTTGNSSNPPKTNVFLAADAFQPAGVVISELSDDAQTIELVNAGETPVDLTDWNLYAGSSLNLGDVSAIAHRRVPGPAWLAPGAALVWTCRSNATEVFPTLVSTHRFRTTPGNGRMGLVEVRDGNGNLVDQVINDTSFLGPLQPWSGPTLTFNYFSPGPGSRLRIGNGNSFSARDWVEGPSRIGQPKTGLNLPWLGHRIATTLTPSQVVLTNGVWSGMVQVQARSTVHLIISADDGTGVRSDSPVVTVPTLTPLILNLTSGTNQFSEANPGNTATVAISLPDGKTASSPIPVQLSWDAPGEFISPNSAVIPPGASQTTVTITNLDDSIADGRAVVVLSAAANGYAPAMMSFVNDDNETGTLTLSNPTMPAKTYENAGLLNQRGSVFLPQPSAHTVEINLSSSGRVQVPAKILLPVGQSSAQFPVWITDDNVVDNVPNLDTITAQTSDWPPATVVLNIQDDENPSASFSFPKIMREGDSNIVQIAVSYPRLADVDIALQSSSQRLVLPLSVHLPAGSTSVEFPIVALDNEVKDCGVSAAISAIFPGFVPSFYGSVAVQDRQISLDALTAQFPASVYSGSPSRLIAFVTDSCGLLQQTNVLASVSIAPAISPAQVDTASQSITLTNGQFGGDIVLKGEVIGGALTVDAEGLHAAVTPIDVISGRLVPGTFQDIAAWPGSSNLLALQSLTNQSGVSSTLIQLTPGTGAIANRLDLPTFATRLAVSDNGRVAWLAANADSLLRVNLDTWSFDRILPISTNVGIWKVASLALGQGTTDQIAAIVFPVASNSSLPKHLAGSTDGFQWMDGPSVDSGGYGADITAGYVPGEFYAIVSGVIQRLAFANGHPSTVVARNLVSLALANLIHPVPMPGRVVLGNGFALDPQSLSTLPDFAAASYPPKNVVLPMPDLGIALFIDDRGGIRIHDLISRSLIGGHGLPLMYQAPDGPDRLVRWGARGAAALSSFYGQLQLFESPLLSPGGADLALTVDAPQAAILPGNDPNGNPISWRFTVTNQGPGIAHQVQFQLDQQPPVNLGTLAPGTSITITNNPSWSSMGVYTNLATVSSPVADGNPSNNRIALTTRVTPLLPPAFGPEAILNLAGRRMITDSSNQFLFVSSGLGGGAPGVAVVDPIQAKVTQTFPVGDDPQDMALSPDGQHLFVQLGDNRIVRWDMTNGSIGLDFTVPGGGITDLVVLPEARGRLMVATLGSLLVYDGSNQLQNFQLRAAPNRSVGIIGNNLWTAGPGLLIPFPITSGNLVRAASVPAYLPDGDYSFKASGQQLVFKQAVFDRPTGHVLLPANGGLLFPSLGRWAWAISGYQLQRYDVSHLTIDSSSLGLPVASDIIPGLNGFGTAGQGIDLGTNGFAALNTSGDLLLFKSGVKPVGTADLAIGFAQSTQIFYGEPFQFLLTITNRGPDLAPLTKLMISDLDAQLDYPTYSLNPGTQAFLGDIPSGGSLLVALRGTPLPWVSSINFSIAVDSGAQESNPVDNTVYPSQFLQLDTNQVLSFGLVVPHRAAVGETLTALCSVTNIGSKPFYRPSVLWSQSPGLRLLSTDAASIDTNCCSGTVFRLPSPTLDPGQVVSFHATFQVNKPGLFPIQISSATQNANENPVLAAPNEWLYMTPPDGLPVAPNFNLPLTQVTWSQARGLWIGWGFGNIVFLKKDTLEPLGSVAFWEAQSQVVPTDDGHFVWANLSSGEIARLSLNSGDLEYRTNLFGFRQGNFLPVPGDPDSVVGIGVDSSGQSFVFLYSHGVIQPSVYKSDLASNGPQLRMIVTPDRRIFVATGTQLRELRLDPTGLSWARDLNVVSQFPSAPLRFAEGVLMFDFNQAIRVDDPNLTVYTTAGVDTAFVDGVGYSFFSRQNQEVNVQAYQVSTNSILWTTPILGGFNGVLASGGTGGALLTGQNGGWVRPPPNPGVDLSLSATHTESSPGTNGQSTINVTITKQGNWSAINARLKAEYSPGLVADTPSSTSTNWSLPLGNLSDATNLTLSFSTIASGRQFIHLTLESDSIDPNPSNNQIALEWFTLPPPVLLLDDLPLTNVNGYVPFRISTPALTNVRVSFQIDPLDSLASTLLTTNFIVEFQPGTMTAAVGLLANDYRAEPTQHFRVKVVQSPIPTTRSDFVVTLLNGVRPQLSARSVSAKEGNAGYTTNRFAIVALQPSAIPLSVGYQTVPGTATPGVDYLPVSGRLVFQPGQQTNYVDILVAGDTLFEPDETVTLQLSDPTVALLPPTDPVLTILNDDPLTPASITPGLGSDGSFSIRFLSLKGAKYTVQSRTNLLMGSWQSIRGPIPGTSDYLNAPLTNSLDGQHFFRVLAE